MAAQTAKENDFDIIANPSLESQISSAGKYQGFPIASLEKYKTVETSITTGFSLNNPSKIVVEKNRYTKTNIDEFRKFFTNDLNQSDPKYFRGFRPGDIKQLPDGKVVSVNHQADIRDKTDNHLPDNKWVEKKIKNRYSAEIETKKNEVIDRMKMLFQAEIDAAANEDYGSGRLSSERKSIFTTHRSQIENLSLLTEIKQLIKSLVKAERFIAEFKNLDKMASAQKLKEEYRNGSGDKKTAYTIVNQVDN
ncbi:11698_t:CDS:2, partial [Ambispora leptoticha]